MPPLVAHLSGTWHTQSTASEEVQWRVLGQLPAYLYTAEASESSSLRCHERSIECLEVEMNFTTVHESSYHVTPLVPFIPNTLVRSS